MRGRRAGAGAAVAHVLLFMVLLASGKARHAGVYDDDPTVLAPPDTSDTSLRGTERHGGSAGSSVPPPAISPASSPSDGKSDMKLPIPDLLKNTLAAPLDTTRRKPIPDVSSPTPPTPTTLPLASLAKESSPHKGSNDGPRISSDRHGDMNCPVTFSTGDIQYKDVTYKVPRKLCLPQIDAATILESGCIFSNAKPSDGHPWDHCNDPNTASGFSGQSADRMSSAGSSDGKKYVSFIFEYNDSFQHIVFDSLPKTWQLCDYFKANKDLGILVTSDLQRELMQLACELPLERFTVRPFKASMPLSAASIAVPHYFPDSPDVRQDIPPFASFQSFGPQTGPGRKAIYMPRRQNSGGNRAKRHVTNDDEVVAALRERFGNDFVEFTPSDWHTDRAVLKEAGWIIAPHGGAESNMVFCPKGTTVIEFLPLTKIKKSGQNERACFFGLAHALGFRYVAVEPDSFSFDGDMTVPIDKLKEVLRQ